MMVKLWQWLRARDVQLNESLGGNKGETISSRLGRHINRDGCFFCKIFCVIILLPLGLLVNHSFEHCRKSVQKQYTKRS